MAEYFAGGHLRFVNGEWRDDNGDVIEISRVRHGRWTDGDTYCPICGKNKFLGLDADIWADWQPDYCPNCGAKMDGDDGNSVMSCTRTNDGYWRHGDDFCSYGRKKNVD